MKKILIIITGLLFLSSCKTLQFSSIPNGTVLQDKIVPLKPEFDFESFGPDYADLYDFPVDIIFGGPTLESTVRNTTDQFKIAEDTKRIYYTEITKNISERVGETKGVAVVRRGMRTKGIKSYVNPVVSILSLGIANLFGYPVAVHRDELELIVDIYDMDDKVVASYAGFGTGEAKEALYSGYQRSDARRLAHAQAFKMAMDEIKDQLYNDRLKINRELE